MKILLIKLGARGDVLRTTSLLPAIKDKYKPAEIWWMTGGASEEILLGNPYLKKVIVYEEKKHLELLENLKKEQISLVINLEESPATASIASSLDAEKIGFLYKNGSIYPSHSAEKYWKMSILGPSPENNILKRKNTQTYQDLIGEMLDLPRLIEPPVFLLNKEHERFTLNLFKNNGVTEDKTLVGINFGSGVRWPTKRLPLKKVKELIENLKKKKNYKIVVFGGKNEEKEISMLKNKYPDLIFAYLLPLKKFASVIKCCSILVTTDTFALHLALALGTRVIALFGSTSAAEIELFNSGEKLIAPVDCYCCYKKYCHKRPFCMELFDSKEIIKKIRN